jgi:hypothetical protein
VISALSNDSVAGTLNVTELILGRCAPDQPGEYKHSRQQNCKNAQSGHGPVPPLLRVNSSSNEGISMLLENSHRLPLMSARNLTIYELDPIFANREKKGEMILRPASIQTH